MAKHHQEKKNRPLISVVVLTCLGRRKELSRCLNSVKNSNYRNREIILVVNGCIPALVKEVGSRFPKVKVIQLPANTGCFGFNIGYINARGQYILSLDDDTSIKPDTLERIVEVFEKKPQNVGILSIKAYNPLTQHFYISPTKGFISFQAGGAVFRKELFEKIGYYDKDFFLWGQEDGFTLRVLNVGYKIDFEKDIVINHYEKIGKLRKKQIFLNARNKAWISIKHFSLIFIPLIVLRDLVWLLLLPHRKKSFRALWYGFAGYFSGWLNFTVPLKKRKVISSKVQKKFINFYLLSDPKRIKSKRWY